MRNGRIWRCIMKNYKLRYRVSIISLMMFLAATAVQAQITIGGNVYGGGNAGDTGGNTKVVV